MITILIGFDHPALNTGFIAAHLREEYHLLIEVQRFGVIFISTAVTRYGMKSTLAIMSRPPQVNGICCEMMNPAGCHPDKLVEVSHVYNTLEHLLWFGKHK